MTPQEVLDRMIPIGCVCDVSGVGYVPVGNARVVGTAVVWCLPYPEDQHHGHVSRGDELEVNYDRDVGVKKDGRYVAYFAPYTEFELYDPRWLLAALPGWLKEREGDLHKRDFDAFVASMTQ